VATAFIGQPHQLLRSALLACHASGLRGTVAATNHRSPLTLFLVRGRSSQENKTLVPCSTGNTARRSCRTSVTVFGLTGSDQILSFDGRPSYTLPRGYLDRVSKQLASTCCATSVSTMSLYQKKDSTVRHSFSFFGGVSNCTATGSTTEADAEDRLLG